MKNGIMDPGLGPGFRTVLQYGLVQKLLPQIPILLKLPEEFQIDSLIRHLFQKLLQQGLMALLQLLRVFGKIFQKGQLAHLLHRLPSQLHISDLPEHLLLRHTFLHEVVESTLSQKGLLHLQLGSLRDVVSEDIHLLPHEGPRVQHLHQNPLAEPVAIHVEGSCRLPNIPHASGHSFVIQNEVLQNHTVVLSPPEGVFRRRQQQGVFRLVAPLDQSAQKPYQNLHIHEIRPVPHKPLLCKLIIAPEHQMSENFPSLLCP